MSAPRKRWDAHSERWKREKTKQGLSRAKWDQWFKLSAKSRKIADPYKYAKGQSVADQRRYTAERNAFRNMLDKFPNARKGTVELGVKEMTAAQLRWTAKASAAQLRVKAKVKPIPGERNPWWYN